MLSVRLDKWTRVAAGFGLLLLLVVQEKVCPWLVTPPSEAEPASSPAPAPSDEPQEQQKPAKPKLAHILPDAAGPRWPVSWCATTLRQTTGLRDGVVPSGLPNPNDDGQAGAAAASDGRLGWHVFLIPVEPRPFAPALWRAARPPDPAIGRAIIPLGPPAV